MRLRYSNDQPRGQVLRVENRNSDAVSIHWRLRIVRVSLTRPLSRTFRAFRGSMHVLVTMTGGLRNRLVCRVNFISGRKSSSHFGATSFSTSPRVTVHNSRLIRLITVRRFYLPRARCISKQITVRTQILWQKIACKEFDKRIITNNQRNSTSTTKNSEDCNQQKYFRAWNGTCIAKNPWTSQKIG